MLGRAFRFGSVQMFGIVEQASSLGMVELVQPLGRVESMLPLLGDW